MEKFSFEKKDTIDVHSAQTEVEAWLANGEISPESYAPLERLYKLRQDVSLLSRE
jgi:hypothetical protein